MLPSVNPQKPEVADPSWASLDVTLALMTVGERLIRIFDPLSSADLSTVGDAGMRHKADFAGLRNWYYRSALESQPESDSTV